MIVDELTTPEQIDAAARELRAMAKDLQWISASVAARMTEAQPQWAGPDLKAFKVAWFTTYRLPLLAAVVHLHTMANQLAHQANEERAEMSRAIMAGWELGAPKGPDL